MFAGHLGAAFAVGRIERRVNVAVFVAAALLLDLVLWVFVLIGWESVTIPADFAATHQAEYVFPYSHGLIAAIAWSALAAAIAVPLLGRLGAAKWRAAALVAAAVFSHWLLDALVHRPELPLLGARSTTVGLALWSNLPVALAVEGAIAAIGLLLFVRNASLRRGRSVALGALGLVVLAFTVLGMTIAPPPPSALAMAASSLATLVVVCGLVAWLGRAPRA
jgi:hypothetical protein